MCVIKYSEMLFSERWCFNKIYDADLILKCFHSNFAYSVFTISLLLMVNLKWTWPDHKFFFLTIKYFTYLPETILKINVNHDYWLWPYGSVYYKSNQNHRKERKQLRRKQKFEEIFSWCLDKNVRLKFLGWKQL